MHDNLERLKRLVFDGGYDDESKKHVLDLETRLQKLAEADKIKELPPIKEFLAYMEREISRCETLLQTDESLTDLQRSKLFAIIQVSSKYTKLFTGEAMRNVEEIIKRELDAAKT